MVSSSNDVFLVAMAPTSRAQGGLSLGPRMCFSSKQRHHLPGIFSFFAQHGSCMEHCNTKHPGGDSCKTLKCGEN